ncbi:UNVERIFIED_CONTAM: Retrovirus-related Pol polyprotein from transposon TNT 1-94 [Sesamum latifolium]|uniref:Retrovirus-related Pol polyprotein from transposon TNT 1-94 n=1 Tax=Sesamum latifolium TaxID=2727402 RepID=A0AAW2TDH7_9LAMI
MSFMDSRTNDSELDVQHIIHLQSVANRLPDASTDIKRVTKSHIPAENIPAGLEVSKVILTQSKASESQLHWKHGRPLGSKHVNPRKRKEHIVSINRDANVTTTTEIMDEHENDPKTMEECRYQDELDSLNKREVFGPITPTPKGVKLVGYKWVFMQLMDVVTAYLYGSLDTDIYMRIPEGLKMLDIKVKTPSYVLHQIKKRTESGFVIKVVYVDDLNIIGSPEEIRQAVGYLRSEFEMKDLAHNDEILGPKVPYLSAIGTLMYLANNTRPDIAFSVNLLARYRSTPTKRHWNGVKHMLHYLRGTSDMELYFERHEDAKATNLVGYSDAGYLSDPHKAISQSGYVYMYGRTAISWRSTKQTLVATSSNHAELIALYEAGHECVWLRSLTHYVHESCALESIEKSPTIIYKDNTACIAQIKDGYIKGDRTKHISAKFFSTHELQVEGKVDVTQIPSSQNLADFFTKALPTMVFKQLVQKIGMRHLKDIWLN